MKHLLRKLLEALGNMDLVDRLLFFFLLALLTQSAYLLFTNAPASENARAIDTVTRTSLASIFGYFLSGNFIKTDGAFSSKETGYSASATEKKEDVTLQNPPQSRIGFRVSEREEDWESMGSVGDRSREAESEQKEKLQIFLISFVGIVSLLLLIGIRGVSEVEADKAATISQLRDFVAGCVGFLFSHKKHRR